MVTNLYRRCRGDFSRISAIQNQNCVHHSANASAPMVHPARVATFVVTMSVVLPMLASWLIVMLLTMNGGGTCPVGLP